VTGIARFTLGIKLGEHASAWSLKGHIALATGGYNFCWFYPKKVAWNGAVVVKTALTFDRRSSNS
jgi:hypothetical protein